MTPIIGVDPGSLDGACVLLSPQSVVMDWIAWWATTQGLMVRTQGGDERQVGSRLAEAVHWWAEGLRERAPCGYGLVVEELFLVPGKARPASILTLGEACGRVQGVLELRATGDVRRVRAWEWRGQVLGLRRGTSAKVCEAYAVQSAGSVVRWPRGFPASRSGGEGLPVPARGALAEAACIARWGVVQAGVTGG